MLQYNCCKTIHMVNFLWNVFKNCNKRNRDKLYKDDVHINKVGYQTLMHTIGNSRDFHNRVISLIRGCNVHTHSVPKPIS